MPTESTNMGTTSYVTLEMACGHSIKLLRSDAPENRSTPIRCILCFRQNGLTGVVEILRIVADKEWVARCMECKYAARCGKGSRSMLQAFRLAGSHSNRRSHAVRAYDESDPDGTEQWYRDNRRVNALEVNNPRVPKPSRPEIPEVPPF